MFGPHPANEDRLQKLALLDSYLEELCAALPGSIRPKAVALAGFDFVGSRSTFVKTDASFDPLPYLGMSSAATYAEPRLLLPPPARACGGPEKIINQSR